jgi:hypothetical protein
MAPLPICAILKEWANQQSRPKRQQRGRLVTRAALAFYLTCLINHGAFLLGTKFSTMKKSAARKVRTLIMKPFTAAVLAQAVRAALTPVDMQPPALQLRVVGM